MVPFDTSAELLDRFRRSDPRVYTVLYGMFYADLRRFAIRLLRDEPEGEDVAIQCLTKLFRVKGNFSSLEKMRSFLFTITKNACLDYMKTTQRQQRGMKGYYYLQEEVTDTIPEDSADARLKDIQQVLPNMPARQQLIFEKIYFGGMDIKEVAADLDIEEVSVRGQKAKAIRFIRREIKKNEAPEINLNKPDITNKNS